MELLKTNPLYLTKWALGNGSNICMKNEWSLKLHLSKLLKNRIFGRNKGFWPCCTNFALILNLPIDRPCKVTSLSKVSRCGYTRFISQVQVKSRKNRVFHYNLDLWPCCTTFLLILILPIGRTRKVTLGDQILRCGCILLMMNEGL